MRFVEFVRNRFDRIIVMVSSTVYESYYRDDRRLADYVEVRIEPLTHGQQETLIRRRLALSSGRVTISDGRVDQVEDRVNSVIMSQRLVPRYPFFVLIDPTDLGSVHAEFVHRDFVWSLLQGTYPCAPHQVGDFRSRDSDINPCLNFAETSRFPAIPCKEGIRRRRADRRLRRFRGRIQTKVPYL